MKKPSERFDLKDLSIFLPLAGATIAITFDVGYFSGLEISFFTVFTLTEHISFVLGVIPFAIMALLGVSAFVSLILDIPKPRFLTWMSKWRVRIGLAIIFLSPFVFAAAIWNPQYFLILISVILLVSGAYLAEQSVAIIKISIAALSFLYVTYIIGFYYGVRPRDDTSARQVLLLENEVLKGRILRAGERGVLFYDFSDKQAVLVRWPEIKKIKNLKSDELPFGCRYSWCDRAPDKRATNGG